MTLPAHKAIIELGKALGYIDTLVDIDLGLCAGISVLWMKARLVHQEDRFNARIQRIIDENDTLAEQIEAVKRKVIAKEILSANDNDLLEILAFYDGIVLHQAPGVFSEALDTSYRQRHIVKISDFSQSLALEASEGLREIHSQANVFSVDEIIDYFKSLADILSSITPPLTEPIGFVLHSYDHAISLCYDVTSKLWTFMDINSWPPKITEHESILAIHIRESSGYTSPLNVMMSCFSIQMFAKGDEMASDLFDVFKVKHRLRPEKVAELDEKLLALMLDYSDDVVTIVAEMDKLPQGFELLSTPDSNGYTPVSYAAAQDQVLVIAEIGKLSRGFELLSMLTRNGYTPATLAAVRGHVSVIAEIGNLALGFELLSMASRDGYTPATFAVLHGQVSVIAEIAELPRGFELLSTPDVNGYTPATLAVLHGQVSVIAEIGKLARGYELLSTPDNSGFSSAYIAARNGKDSVIAEMGKLAQGFELLSAASSDGYTPATVAAEKGQVLVIAEMGKLAQGFELLSTASSDGYTPATVAALHGHASVIAEMAKLPRGYELLSTPDRNGYTAAYIAAYNGQVSVMTELAKLAQGYELLSTAGRDGYTPASTAAENGDVAVIEAIAHLPCGLELLKSVNIDKLSALPSLMAKKCAANILLEEVDRLSKTHAPEDKMMFMEQQQMQLSEANASTMDEMIEKLKRHLYAVKELNNCIKKIQEGGLFDAALKREKAKNIELALISIPLNQRDSILLQDTLEKRNLCRVLDLYFPSWRKEASSEVDEGTLGVIEESGSGFFKQFK